MIIDRSDIKFLCELLRKNQKKIVFTNGCFDIIHAGHVKYLTQAKSFGDVLILGLNTDDSVRKLKGSNRPINSEADRSFVIDGLKAVDYVILFSESTAENLVAEIKPDIYVKGGDYNLENLPEGKIVQSYGGQVKLIPLLEGRSTSNIISRIEKS